MKSRQITEQIYLADAEGARFHHDTHVCDEVVTLGYVDRLPRKSTTNDTLTFPDGDHEYENFERATDYVIDCLQYGKTVMVHCASGRSRCCGVITAVLSTHKTISLETAFEEVQSKAPNTDPLTPIRESMEQYTDDTLDDYRSRL